MMKIKCLLSGLILQVVISVSLFSNDTTSVTFMFAGDIMGHDSQIAASLVDSTQGYNYDSCFTYISSYIKKADVAIANLEVTLAGPPFKGYPQFSSPDELAKAAKNVGFDVLVTANNHSLDRGKKGLERTIKVLDSLEIIFTGTFANADERAKRYPLIFEKNNVKIALLNYTYGTNGLMVSEPNIVNYIDTDVIIEDVERAKLQDPDFIIATMHWGLEYKRSESSNQQSMAEFLFGLGVNAIIGSHPHVVQPIKKMYINESDSSTYNLVVYSLGNFISNQRKRYTDGGIMFYMELEKVNEVTRIKSYSYLPTWVYKPWENGKRVFRIVPANAYKNGLRGNKIPEDSSKQMEVFYNDTKMLLKNVPEYEVRKK